ncbi:MAG: lytic murein transglycosylase [Candidatus Paceibacter sp.]|nr:lytic murein transglycosylase [Candidatus Paceibacter sp.]
MLNFLKILSSVLFAVSFLYFTGGVLAQSGAEAVNQRKEELQKELDNIEAQINGYELVIKQKQNESASLERDIALLNAKISKAKLEIQKREVEIAKAKTGISQKNGQITILTDKSEKQKDSLAELLRKSSELDSTGLAEIILGYGKMSDFLVVAETLEPVQDKIQEVLDGARKTKNQLEKEKEGLQIKQAEQTRLKNALEQERKNLAASEAEKKKLLTLTKGLEKNYKIILASKHLEAAKIRSALFALRDTAAIPFGEAYGYALEAQKKTGVRPAFLLAILTQESNLGENTGQCLVTNFQTGDGVGKNTGTFFKGVMKPSRDIQPFLDIAGRLGFDPKTRPVSCPQSVGYGGAMGPSQFIPSTWKVYESKIAAASGAAIPNPWIPRDAFFASAIYLADLGADEGTYAAEHEAAARYYAGGNWYKSSGQNYGSSVMKHARNIQENMIDPLNLY